ncbi:hypothetical protein JCM10212_005847 [Sporobolomyces blumeae]
MNRLASVSARSAPSACLWTTQPARGLASTSSIRSLPSPTARLASRAVSSSAPTRASTNPVLDHESDPSHRREGASATAVFYRNLVPSMLQCLALGSIVYYALELTWMTLDRERKVERLSDEVTRLERELELARRRGTPAASETATDGRDGRRPWWKFW